MLRLLLSCFYVTVIVTIWTPTVFTLNIDALQADTSIGRDFHLSDRCRLNLLGMRYFQWLNASAYIECNQMAMGAVRLCRSHNNRKRSNKRLSCTKMNGLRGSVLSIPSVEATSKCDYCDNGGICDSGNKAASCICSVKFVGLLCERVKLNETSEFERLLNDSFTFEAYAQAKVEAMHNQNASLSSLTGHPVKSTAHVSCRSFRQFWSSFVDALWGEINAPGRFLHKFNYSALHSKTHLGSGVHKCLINSKDVMKNFGARFQLLQRVLNRIVRSVEDSSDAFRKNLKAFADDQFNVKKFKTETLTRNEGKKNEQLQSKFQTEMTLTYNATHTLFTSYSLFKEKQQELVKIDQHVSTSAYLKSPYVQELTYLLQNSSISNWNMIVDYGFWYLTYSFATASSSIKTIEEAAISEAAKSSIRKRSLWNPFYTATSNSSGTQPIFSLFSNVQASINKEDEVTISNKLALQVWKFW